MMKDEHPNLPPGPSRKPSQNPTGDVRPRMSTGKGPVVYWLPESVLDEMEKELPSGMVEKKSETEAPQRETNPRDLVGEVAGKPIWFQHLRPSVPMALSAKEAKFLGLNPAEASQLARTRNHAFETSSLQAQRGYLGWLMTQRVFIEEHDQLVDDFAEAFRQHGFTSVRLAAPPKGTEPVTDGPPQDFMDGCKALLLRWRLAGLAGPYLPVPQSILLSGDIPPFLLEPLQESGKLFFIPDTIPIPARDELRNYLSSGLRGSDDDPNQQHIAGWRKIIRNDNSARTQINRYARIFELQHYWRLIHVRSPEAIRGNKGRLQQAMANYFKTSAKTIKVDLELVRKGLGQGWETRKSPLE